MSAPVPASVLGLPAPTTATLTETAPPSPPPAEEVPGYSSPGVEGFLVTFALVVACIPLFISMVRKVRGVRYGAPEADPAGEAGDADAPEPPR